jgi:hypothetical protein
MKLYLDDLPRSSCSGSGVVGGNPAPTWATFDPLP